MKVLDTHLNVFVSTCVKLEAELARFGIEVDSFSDFAREKLVKSSPQEVLQAEERMKKETARFSKISSCEASAQWETQQLWSFLKENKFKFSDDLFENLEDGCFLEVYGMNSKALYRSPNCYRVVSYSLGGLFLCTWNELFSRSEVYVLDILKSLYAAFEAPVGTLTNLDHIPAHTCFERYSSRMISGTTQLKFFSTVENASGVKFVITVNKITGLKSLLEEEA